MNLFGCFIVLMDLVAKLYTIEQSVDLLLAPLNWIIMWCRCGGWILYLFFPPFVSSYLSYMNEERMKGRYKNWILFEEWGEEVKQKAPGTN